MRLTPPASLFCCLSLFLTIYVSASARVGETQDEFEKRILQPDLGKFMPKEKFADPNRELEVARQQPFNTARAFFPENIRERRYWKSAVPNMLSNENGWKIHVFFLDNKSVMEAYQRISEPLNEFEIRIILEANQGTSEWHRVEDDLSASQTSAIGCDYQLVDQSLRAKVSGNWLIVYSVTLDNYVKDQKRIADNERANEAEERLRRQQRTAPSTTSGF